MHPAKPGVFYQNGGTFPKKNESYDTIGIATFVLFYTPKPLWYNGDDAHLRFGRHICRKSSQRCCVCPISACNCFTKKVYLCSEVIL